MLIQKELNIDMYNGKSVILINLFSGWKTTILDGRDGTSLLDSPLVDTMGAQSSPLTISMDGYGNDVYLYWISDCENHEGHEEAYKFVKGNHFQ